MYSHCEILFPHSKVSGLKRLKSSEWQDLVEYVATLPETHIDALAFSHMMIKVCDCLNCDLGSYKAALGCAACSQRTINALRDTDKQLLRRYKRSRSEMLKYLNEIGMGEAEPEAVPAGIPEKIAA